MGGELHGTRILALVLFGLILCGPGAYAQSGPQGVGRELALWTGGGHGINGSTSDTGVWNVGGRYGWVLTNPAGPRFLRGRFEYAVDVVPIFWRSEEHTSELQSRPHLVCRLLLEKKK